MKYSHDWLQKHIVEPLPPVVDLEQKIIFHAFEVEESEQVDGDTVMEIKVLPDRAGDACSHYGMAREVAGLCTLTLKKQEIDTSAFPRNTEGVSVSIKSDLCDRYMAIRMEGVSVTDSPAWLQKSLTSIGQKSINTVVDATNYILNDLGQPTHAFDADKIVGSIVVRMAHEGETVTTLSQEEKVLKESDVVIADDDGVLAIAGVKGGIRAEVTKETKNIILEIAHFDATAVRKTSRRLGLITDASKRFENNISSVIIPLAANSLIKLVTEVARGTAVALSDQNNTVEIEREIPFLLNDITRILGESITEENITDVFNRYSYSYAWTEDNCTLAVPYWRADIIGVHDIAEEIGRVIGYDTIAVKALPFIPVYKENDTDIKIQSIKKYLTEQGFSEVVNYSFRKKGDIYVTHAPKDKSALRTNLRDGIKESFEMNRLNAPLLGVTDVQIFEVGTIFTTEGESIHVATATKKEIQEMTLDEYIHKHNVDIKDSHLEINIQPNLFKMWSNYPYIVRDVAVWLEERDTQTKDTLEVLMKIFADTHTVMPMNLFDSFVKEGRVSYAYRFVFQATDHTLTDVEVTQILEPLLQSIRALPHTELR